MDGKNMENENKNRTLSIIGIIILIIVLSISVIFVTFSELDQEKNSDNQTNSNEIQTHPINLTLAAANDLIIQASNQQDTTSYNLTVVDCRGLEGCSSCQFNRGHLPGAEMNINPSSLFNSTADILVYSKDGTVGYDFCKDLIGNVTGKVYNLEGGYEAWVNAGYTVEKS